VGGDAPDAELRPMTIEAIPAADAPKDDAPHRVVLNFPNDHDIGGMKIEVVGVTAEQLSVAIFHLNRVAMQLVDFAAMQSRMDSEQIAEVARALQGGGKIVLPGRRS
jgi:hypothetical protein